LIEQPLTDRSIYPEKYFQIQIERTIDRATIDRSIVDRQNNIPLTNHNNIPPLANNQVTNYEHCLKVLNKINALEKLDNIFLFAFLQNIIFSGRSNFFYQYLAVR
jgi:hypothetical protein